MKLVAWLSGRRHWSGDRRAEMDSVAVCLTVSDPAAAERLAPLFENENSACGIDDIVDAAVDLGSEELAQFAKDASWCSDWVHWDDKPRGDAS